MKSRVQIITLAVLIYGLLLMCFHYIYIKEKKRRELITKISFEANVVKVTFSEHIHSHLNVADVDNDGIVEIIFGTQEGSVVIFDPLLLNVEWFYKIGKAPVEGLSVADLNNDGFLDIVACSRGSPSYIIALSPVSRSVLWEIRIDDDLKQPPLIADVNGDGIFEVLVCGSYGGTYCISGHNGSLIWSVLLRECLNKEIIHIFFPCTITDINDDGNLDVIFECDVQEPFIREYIIAINCKTGEVIYIEKLKQAQLVVAGDLNNDEDPEIIIACIGNILIFNSSMSLIRNITLPGRFPWVQGMAIGDINNDGMNEIIAATFDFHVFAINYYGKILWCSNIEWSPWFTHPILADVNGDGTLDVIVAAFHHLVYTINGFNGSIIFAYNSSEIIPNSPCAIDIDRDNLVEVVFASENSLYILQTNGTCYFWYSFMGDCRNCGNSMMLVDPFFNPIA